VSKKSQRFVYAALTVLAVASLMQFAQPAPASASTVEQAACVASAPDNAKCGLMSVPENRANPATRAIKVPYEVIPAAKQPAAATPVVVMAGGLGESLSALGDDVAKRFGLGDDRDIVLIGQRGGEGSEPRLDCPDASNLLAETFESTDRVTEEATDVALSMSDCLTKFVAAGGDPTGYTISQTAQDVIDLRVLLGYPAWTAVGSDWAAKVMSVVARFDPAGTNAVVLDSFAPLDRDVKSDAYESVSRALTDLSARPGSPSKDLNADLAKAAVLFDEAPVTGPVTNPFTGKQRYYELGGSDLYTLVQQALADPEVASTVPALIERLTDGDLDAVQAFIPFAAQSLGAVDWAQYFVSSCLDEKPYWKADPVAPEPTAEDDDPVAPPLLTYLSVTDVVCDQLALAVPAPDLRVPASFAQPTLVLASESDPFVPAAAIGAVLTGTPNATVQTFPGAGGAVLGSGGCAAETVKTWLADPTKDVSKLCDHDKAVVPLVDGSSIHLTSRYGSVATAANQQNWIELLIPILFFGFCALWFIGWLITVLVRALEREPIRLLIASGITPVSGLVFTGIGVAALWSAQQSSPAQSLVGVPSLIPGLGVLLIVGFLALILVWKLGSRGAAVLASLAVPFWLAMAGWFVWIFVLPS
jgi:pimeloyl-ACP methyl ester carboxylesterase